MTADTPTFRLGDRVEKRTGYRWPGVIVSVFKTSAGKTRVVVECTVPEVAGALHIYSPEQIRLVEDADGRVAIGVIVEWIVGAPGPDFDLAIVIGHTDKGYLFRFKVWGQGEWLEDDTYRGPIARLSYDRERFYRSYLDVYKTEAARYAA